MYRKHSSITGSQTMNALTKQTTGTMTAKSEGEADFEASAGFSVRRGIKHWEIEACDEADDPADNRFFTFYVPISLPDGEPKVYPLSPNNDPEKALAYYGSKDLFIPSYEGELTITYSVKDQNMIGKFKFKCKAWNKEFILSEGEFDLTGIMDAKANPVQTFIADLTGGISKNFKSEPISFKRIGEELLVLAEQIVWDAPENPIQQVRLYIKDGVKKGDHYFKRDDENIRAIYYVLGGEPVLTNGYGTLKLLADPSENEFQAKLNFTMEPVDKPKIILTNGVYKSADKSQV